MTLVSARILRSDVIQPFVSSSNSLMRCAVIPTALKRSVINPPVPHKYLVIFDNDRLPFRRSFDYLAFITVKPSDSLNGVLSADLGICDYVEPLRICLHVEGGSPVGRKLN